MNKLYSSVVHYSLFTFTPTLFPDCGRHFSFLSIAASAGQMNVCRLCLSEGVGYPSIYTTKSYVNKLVVQLQNVVGQIQVNNRATENVHLY